MNDNDMLNTFKKHLFGLDELIDGYPSNNSYNFGETMKGVNEFVGSIQSLRVHLKRIVDLLEKIHWIDDLLHSDNSSSSQQMLSTERQNYLSSIHHILNEAKFMGVQLFNTRLSCSVGNRDFILGVVDSTSCIGSDSITYCVDKINEIDTILTQISKHLKDWESNKASGNLNEVNARLSKMILE